MELTIRDDIRKLIPPLTDDERRQLEANIRVDGCRDSLVVWPTNGTHVLLDGHHRKEICEEHGLSFKTRKIHCDNENFAKVWVINNQFGRRNLNPYQRAELTFELEKYLPREKPGPKTGVTLSKDQVTNPYPHERAAKLAGMSSSQYNRAKYVDKHADEETKEKLRKGEATIAGVRTDMRNKEKGVIPKQKRLTSKQLNAPLSKGLDWAKRAVWQMKQIDDTDPERKQAFEFVRTWLNENEHKNTVDR